MKELTKEQKRELLILMEKIHAESWRQIALLMNPARA
jgi:hypothetical protein